MTQGAKDLTEKVKEHKRKVERLTLTVNEAAEVLGVGQSKMRELIRAQDGVPSIKVGTRILIPIKRFEEWIDNSAFKEF